MAKKAEYLSRNSLTICLVAVLALVLGLTACTKKVQVPAVTGMTTDQAGPVLASAQLKPGKITSQGGGVLPTAKILSQSPSAGQAVAPNTSVDLVVEAPIAVPQLVNMEAADALLMLENAGLKAALAKKTTILHWGTVTQQDIAPGTMVTPDTIVTLTVASPPNVSALQGLLSKQPAYQKLSQKGRDLMNHLSQ